MQIYTLTFSSKLLQPASLLTKAYFGKLPCNFPPQVVSDRT